MGTVLEQFPIAAGFCAAVEKCRGELSTLEMLSFVSALLYIW